ncbi:hypothetical protein HYH03_008178 [Edaphochlamys debaryana]|uniref:RBR-type E3 ubiquitin transferase n=1 Tax=Edaphochlamys debaryana TaxID=47281 RepID=A0A835Y1Q5_9CHLO|nr:hypothetical protein HYH03_008178 [Edaphochlamys debaryana]|eukprot:KAG2493664.1 hypothetical protein HYH03_008178 [Edaphochlamys debaryana]
MAPSGGGGGADVVAVGGWSGHAGADAEAWQAQVEELLALQSVYESGFSILSAPGVHPGSGSGSGPGSSNGAGGSGGRSGSPGGSSDGGGGGASGAWAGPLDAEELLALGPPPELTGAGPSSLGPSGPGPGPGPGWFVAEALVSCEVPPGGLQLVVEMPPMQPPPPPSPSPSPKPLAPSANEPPAAGPGSGPGQGQAQARAQAGPRVQGKQGGAQSPAGAKEADGRAGGRGRGGGRGGRSSGREGGRGGRAGPHSPPTPPIVVDAAPAPAPAPTPPPPPPVTVIPSEPPPPPQPPTRIPFGAPLHHLSPISVTLAFPPSYPAAEPPRVALRAPWLRPGQAAALRTALLQLWDEQGPGGPVAWTWLEWLRMDALQALGLTRELLLKPPSGGGAEDDEAGAEEAGAEAGTRLSRAELAAALAAAEADAQVVAAAAAQKGGAGYGGGGGAGGAAAAAAVALAAAGELQAVALAMARYSALRERQVFDSSNVSCSICLDEHLGARCVRLPECGDAFCGGCLATHLRTQLREGAVGNMRCPAPACRRQLPPALLREMLEPGEFERWEQLTLQRTLDTMEDLVYCPRCRQPCLEDPDHSVLCPSCFFSFCSLCEESWHPGSACLDPEARLTLLEARRRRVAGAEAGEGGEGEGDEEGGEGGGAGRHRVSLTELARKELDKRNQLKSLAMMRSTTRQCPMCHMAVEKSEGCNKMTCAYCGTFFCWKCGMSIHGYDHFSQEPGQGGCVLFDQEEIDRWNARWGGPARPEPRQPPALAAWMQGVPAGQEVRIRHCTVCGQPNVKVGNNNAMRCWSCNSHFCYLCRAWLRNKPGEHFGAGAGKCRQHSPD